MMAKKGKSDVKELEKSKEKEKLEKETVKSVVEERVFQVHDDFFRQTMSNMDLAKEFLENFLEYDVLKKIDLSTLVKMEDTYVTKKGKKYYTDALYSMKYDEKRDGMLYILMEHKSYQAKGVIFQLLEYLAQIYQKHYNKKSGKVPIVIPVVVYHGIKKWNAEREFLKHVDIDLEEDRDLLKYIPNFVYKLYDIPRMEISEEELSNELKCFVMALGIRNHKKRLKDFIRTLDKVEQKDWGLQALKYLEEIITEEERATLEEIIEKENLRRGDEFMTIAQSYRQEGRIEGRIEGRLEGKLEGILETKIELARTLLGLLPDEVIAEKFDLAIKEIEKLKLKN